jgi:hypothetical protein
MVSGVAAIVAIVAFVEPAFAEEPSLPCRPAAASPAPELADEESAFERDFATFSLRRTFTERLVREREARAFEAEQVRFARFWALTKKLAEDAARATERDFDRAVELYLAKIKLTDELAEGREPVPTPTPNW